MAAVRVGLIGDQFIVNPSAAEMMDSRLDLMLAGTGDRLAMIEGYCKWLSNAEMTEVGISFLEQQLGNEDVTSVNWHCCSTSVSMASSSPACIGCGGWHERRQGAL